MTDHNDYTPRFHVGDRVHVWESLTAERRDRIVTARRVYRSRKRTDTYYTLRDPYDGPDNAWECALTHAAETVTPETAFSRILSSFDDRITGAELECRRGAYWHTAVHLTVSYVDPADIGACIVNLFAGGPNDARTVQTIGPWTVEIIDNNGSNETYAATGLGDAIVYAANASRSALAESSRS